ncbi:MAG TPA: isochorismatase family cysteine hydrolase [Patescibacteria group bacterium]|nr:isochorismatase family cysteine hydrolase [Patescibacteria group bacterium]
MKTNDELKFGLPGPGAVHLCIDMQRIFAEETPWHTPWMRRILPQVCEIASRHAERTIFTRFVPVQKPGDAEGNWKRYYERWEEMTLEKLDPGYVELIEELRLFTPPAQVLDKKVYSPWVGTGLHAQLQERQVDTLVVTGGETEVCVIAAVAGAVDLGYRVILVTDALCSSSDETHDAMLEIYANRFSMQIETVTTEAILRAWDQPSRK